MTKAKQDMETDSTPNNEVSKKKTCFIIMPIADHQDYPNGHFGRVYDFLIKPACEIAGLEPYRADDNKASDMIMIDILQRLVECDMAICDISSRNANVFFELGLRQAFNKKTILITDGQQVPPFDISGLRNVSYSPSLRVDTVAIEVKKISEMLKETEKLSDDKVNSVVQLLQIRPAKIDSKELSQVDSVVFKMFSDLKEQISELNNTKSMTRYFTKPKPSNTTPFNNTNLIVIPTGYTFDDFYHEIKAGASPLATWSFTFPRNGKTETKEIGNFLFIEEDKLIFDIDGMRASIANTQANRKNIISI